MKKKVWVFWVVFYGIILCALPCYAGPKAVLVESVFEFDILPEGEQITHEFVIRNEGDAPLNIINVLPP